MMRTFVLGLKAFFRPEYTRKQRVSKILKVSDIEALQSDWVKTGNDIKEAMKIYEEKYRG